MAGLLDLFKTEGAKYLRDILPGGLLNPEVPPDAPKTIVGLLPVVGDAISGYDALEAARRGDIGEAALNSLGLLPFVPALAGITRKAPRHGMPYDVYAYHGSPTKNIDLLRADAAPSSSKGVADENAGVVWATTRKKDAENYSGGATIDNPAPVTQFGADKGQIYKIKEKLKNPLVVKDLGDTSPTGRMYFINEARRLGHDGVIFRDVSRGNVADYDVAFFGDVAPVKSFK